MKRFFAGAAAALMAVALLIPVKTEAVSARRAYVLDAVSGRELFARNEDQRSLIASTTKIMTALIICEQCNVLDRMRIPKEAVGIEGSSMYLKEGEVLTLQELLYGLMLSSGNDAAVALAIYCGGTYGGSITAILINTPGTSANAATLFDGYPMTVKGQAFKALQMALYASTIGGLISAVALLFLAPQIAKITLLFGPAEYFALAVFGLCSKQGREFRFGILPQFQHNSSPSV